MNWMLILRRIKPVYVHVHYTSHYVTNIQPHMYCNIHIHVAKSTQAS